MYKSPMIALIVLQATVASNAIPLTPSRASQQIGVMGAKSFLQQTYSDSSMWSQLLKGVATGSKDWLGVANQLRNVSDGGVTAQLQLAVGEALERQPRNVLSMSVPEFGIDVICGAPDTDDVRFNSYDRSMASISKRERAVRALKDEKLRELQESCVATLEQAKANVSRFYGKDH